jgi:transcriptional regulator of nitric oxide reductase
MSAQRYRSGAVCTNAIARHALYALAALLLLWLLPSPALPAPDDAARIARALPAGLQLGPADPRLPVWSVYRADRASGDEPAGWVFLSTDFVRLPGYAGSPVELLIALGRDGRFLSVVVLRQNEPVFVDGLGPAPLARFVAQYAGRSVAERLAPGAGLDAISKATVSLRVVNESVLIAARKVARARLAHLGVLGAPAVRADLFEPADWARLNDEGWLRALAPTRLDFARAFLGSGTAGDLGAALGRPFERFADLRFALLDPPSIGRNLLGEEGHRNLLAALPPGAHAIGVLATGGLSFEGDDVLPRAIGERLALRQDGRALPMRRLDFALVPRLAGMPPWDEFAVMVVEADSGFDPARPWTLRLTVERSAAGGREAPVSRHFDAGYRLPSEFFAAQAAAGPDWRAHWRERAGTLAAIGAALALLGAGLIAQRRLSAQRARFRALRWGFLAFTLVYLGWIANGQLSVLNLVAAVRALLGEFDLSAYLWAPVTVLLWAVVLATLAIWGRGTYCGWLCPFGALQEFAAWFGARLRLPQVEIPYALDRALGKIKYALLALILGAALYSAEAAEWLSELEPFKTAIGLAFQRDWPYVLYAAALLGLSMVAYKGYCRWLCPLGAALALGGRLRRWDWIPRRAECGQPCQRCRRRCRYGAIEPSGAIRYAECFQCLDCVAIYHDRRQCAPLVLADRRLRRALRAAAAPAAVARPADAR